MKIFVRTIFFLLILEGLLPRCANPGRPSGGPKDTIPPELVTSYPVIGQKNFKEQTITLEFSEYVNADKIQQQLIITPRTDITYKSIVKREKLILKLSEPLSDSTTYNFNFASGITDITERNPALNLSLAFSTGPTIDSLSIRGKVQDLLTQLPAKNYLVGLYPDTDSLNYFTDKPLYFTATRDSGSFEINYVKAADYRIISFEDKNNNQTLDPQEESHAFKMGTISLDSSIILKEPMQAVLQNIKPIEIINVRPAGLYIEAKANKYISSYKVSPERFYHNLVGEGLESIRIYKPEDISYADSISLYIQVMDSLGNTDYDTARLTFLPSNRKLAPLTITKKPESILWKDTLTFSATFNKPITAQNLDSIYLSVDSTANIASPVRVDWNTNKTKATFKTIIKPDSVLSKMAKLLPLDTVMLDTLGNYELKPKSPDDLITKIPLRLYIKAKAFISVESDTTARTTWTISKPKKQAGGTLVIKLDTSRPSFTFQMLQGQKPLYQTTNKTDFTLANVKPGTYQIRILIDTNQDGEWSYGNLLKDLEPEQIYLYPDEISVRENWVNEFTISF